MVDEDGILVDIDVQPITSALTCEDRTCDLDEFFSKPFDFKGANGQVYEIWYCLAHRPWLGPGQAKAKP